MAKIKEFCENYKNRATNKLKEDYLKENLKITQKKTEQLDAEELIRFMLILQHRCYSSIVLL